MRKLNDNEQKFIKKIIKFHNETPISFIDFLKDQYFISYEKSALVLDTKKEKANFYLKESENRYKQLSEFYEVIFLCSYLKENRYLNHISSKFNHRFHFVNKQFTESHYSFVGNQKLNENNDYYQINSENIFNKEGNPIFEKIELDKEIYNFIINDLHGVLFISEELKFYVENNFKTKEEKLSNTNKWIAIVAIILSIVIGLAGYFKPDKMLRYIHHDIHNMKKN